MAEFKVSSLQEALALLAENGYDGETLDVYSDGVKVSEIEV